MREQRSIKIFDLANAPPEVRDGEEFAPLKLLTGGTDIVLTVVVVGQYEVDCESAAAGRDTREVTYSEYRLHVWLVDSGCVADETVLLQWTSGRSA